MKCFSLAPSGAPLNVKGEAVDSSSTRLRISWSAPASDRQNGVIIGYRLHYAVSTSRRCSGDILAGAQSVNTTDRSVEINALRKWTEYCVWVRASTGAGDGPPSEGIVTRTGEDRKWINLLYSNMF